MHAEWAIAKRRAFAAEISQQPDDAQPHFAALEAGRASRIIADFQREAEARAILPARQCAVELLEIVRLIPADKLLDFPGYEQEILRYYPGGGK